MPHVHPSLPKATHTGKLKLGAAELDCYVLDDHRRVLSTRAVTRAITGKDHGALVEYLRIKGLKPYISSSFGLVHFSIPSSPNGIGLDAETVHQVLAAYISASAAGALRTARQQQIAAQCALLLAGYALVGLQSLIDEATGYQKIRAANDLQVRLAAFIAEEATNWTKRFPDDLWKQLARLTHWKAPLHVRPRWWGKLVLAFIYRPLLHEDVTIVLREKHSPVAGETRMHQFLTTIGVKRLEARISEVVGLARTCRTLRELRERIVLAYSTEPVQTNMWLG